LNDLNDFSRIVTKLHFTKNQSYHLINCIYAALGPQFTLKMRVKKKAICQIIAVIISFCLVMTLIIYVATKSNSRPRTPDGTIPPKLVEIQYTRKGRIRTNKPWVDTLPTKPVSNFLNIAYLKKSLEN